MESLADLNRKSARGIFWSLAENIGSQAVQLLVTIVLARLLLPEHFGLIGILTIFIVVAQTLLDSGMGWAINQKQNLTHEDASSIFFYHIFLGTLLAILFVWAGPLVASFYQNPLLSPLAQSLSLMIFFSSFGIVPSALLMKRMDFKSISKASILSSSLAGIISIGLAVNQAGAWSLAAQLILAAFARTGLLFYFSGWVPSLLFRWDSIKGMLAFGSRVMLAGLLGVLFQNIYQPIIGKMFSVTEVGYYTRAQALQAAFSQVAAIAVGRVMIPAFSTLQENRDQLRQVFYKTNKLTVFFHFPLMIGLVVIARPLVLLVLSDKWETSVLYFQLLCMASLVAPMQVMNSIILPALGQTRLYFRIEVINKILSAVVILIAIRGSLIDLLYGQIIISIIVLITNSFYSGRFIEYSLARQLLDVLPNLALSIVMGFGVFLIGSQVEPLLLKLIIQILSGIAIYLFLNFLFSRSLLVETYRFSKQLFLSKKPQES